MGHNIYWDDGNAQLKSYKTWKKDLIEFNPDIIIFESTTPIMDFMWNTVNEIKSELKDSIVIMTGYHSKENQRKP